MGHTTARHLIICKKSKDDRNALFFTLSDNINGKTASMKKLKKKILRPSTLDAIKAMRRGGREAEMELLGPGFHSQNRVHKSEMIYTRKKKHKGGW